MVLIPAPTEHTDLEGSPSSPNQSGWFLRQYFSTDGTPTLHGFQLLWSPRMDSCLDPHKLTLLLEHAANDAGLPTEAPGRRQGDGVRFTASLPQVTSTSQGRYSGDDKPGQR